MRINNISNTTLHRFFKFKLQNDIDNFFLHTKRDNITNVEHSKSIAIVRKNDILKKYSMLPLTFIIFVS